MKPIILAVLLVFPAFAVASDAGFSDSEIAKCTQYGRMYEAAARRRDQGVSPQDTLNTTKEFGLISLADQKKAINAVFFDPAFSRAGGEPLSRQMQDFCLYGKPAKFEPLK